MSLQLIPYIVLIAAIVLVLVRPVGKDLMVPTFLLPWAALNPELGVNLSLAKALFLVLTVKYIGMRRSPLVRLPEAGTLSLVMALGFASSILTVLLDESQAEVSGGALRNGFSRALVSIVSLGLSFLPLALLMSRNLSVRAIEIMRVYVLSVFLLCLIGIAQFAVYRATGRDILPIGLLSVSEQNLRTGIGRGVGGIVVMRPSSLAGEPKELGMFAASAIIVVVILGARLIRQRARRLLLLASALVTIVLTQSTSALFVLPLGLGCFFLLKTRARPLPRVAVYLIYLTVSSVLVLSSYYQVATSSEPTGDETLQLPENPSFGQLAYSRTLGRMSVEDFDWVILRKFVENPGMLVFGRGFGMGHVGTAQYIPEAWKHYMGGSIIAPKTGAVFFMVGGGGCMIVTVCLLFANILPGEAGTGRRFLGSSIQNVLVAQSLCIVFFVMMMLRVYLMDVTLLMVGLSKLLIAEADGRAIRKTRQQQPIHLATA